MQGSFKCEGCDPGYIGNAEVGCHPENRTICDDAKTICDGNALCVVRKGVAGYLCQVISLIKISGTNIIIWDISSAKLVLLEMVMFVEKTLILMAIQITKSTAMIQHALLYVTHDYI